MSSKDCTESQRLNNKNATKTRGYGLMLKKVKKSLKKPKEKSYFSNIRGAHEIFGVFHVKNHDFKPKKSYFFPILGRGARAPGAPPHGPKKKR
jgi:hypothetical protein